MLNFRFRLTGSQWISVSADLRVTPWHESDSMTWTFNPIKEFFYQYILNIIDEYLFASCAWIDSCDRDPNHRDWHFRFAFSVIFRSIRWHFLKLLLEYSSSYRKLMVRTIVFLVWFSGRHAALASKAVPWLQGFLGDFFSGILYECFGVTKSISPSLALSVSSS